MEKQSQIEMTACKPGRSAGSLYAERVNPQWVRPLNRLQMRANYEDRVWFTSTGGEGGFHGLRCGALSLMSGRFWWEGFGPT